MFRMRSWMKMNFHVQFCSRDDNLLSMSSIITLKEQDFVNNTEAD